MPDLIRLYVRSVILGFAISALFTAGLVWLDVARIGHLVLSSDIGWVAALMLVFFNGILFASVQFAYRVMGMADEDGKDGGHGALEPVPVRVAVRAARHKGRG